MSCSHKFVATGYCVKCGDTLESIKAAGYDEAMRLLAEQSARVAELEADEKLYIANVSRLEEENTRWAEELHNAVSNSHDAIEERQERDSRIARAVAELEYTDRRATFHVKNAIAILKGQP